MEINLGELARRINGTLQGDASIVISGVAPITSAGPGSVSYITTHKHKKYLNNTSASAVILSENNLDDCPVPAIVTDNPHAAFARAAAILNPENREYSDVHPTAVIADDVVLGDNVTIAPNCIVESSVTIKDNTYIGPGCYIGKGSFIGSDCHIVANISICHGVEIGDRVTIFPGAVLGADGFGYANDSGKWVKIPQLGSLVIGNDVEIGANTTIDRGALDNTIIENGVKIDNLVHIAHNVVIGEDTAIAGCVGIAGSAVIGKRCALGGAVGVRDHIKITDDVQINGMSFVTKSINKPGIYSSGIPVQENNKWLRNMARFVNLDKLSKKINLVEKKLLEKNKDI